MQLESTLIYAYYLVLSAALLLLADGVTKLRPGVLLAMCSHRKGRNAWVFAHILTPLSAKQTQCSRGTLNTGTPLRQTQKGLSGINVPKQSSKILTGKHTAQHRKATRRKKKHREDMGESELQRKLYGPLKVIILLLTITQVSAAVTTCNADTLNHARCLCRSYHDETAAPWQQNSGIQSIRHADQLCNCSMHLRPLLMQDTQQSSKDTCITPYSSCTVKESDRENNKDLSCLPLYQPIVNLMAQDRSTTPYCPMLVQGNMKTKMKFLSLCEFAGPDNHYTVLAQPAGIMYQHTLMESTDFHRGLSLDMYSAADRSPSHTSHRNLSLLSMSHRPTGMCPKQVLSKLSLWRGASWRLHFAEATYARYNTLHILVRALTTVTGNMKAQCNHLLHTCVAGIALTCQAFTAGLVIVWTTAVIFATALHTPNASTQPCRLQTPMLAQITQCIAYIVWLIARITTEALSDAHCAAAVYTAILFIVHGFLLSHHPGWSIGTICADIQQVPILCIMTWHTVGSIMPLTKIIMQAMQDTLQLMAPNNKSSYMHSPPKFRNGRYWRRIRYSKRRFQRQPLCKLTTLLYIHTGGYIAYMSFYLQTVIYSSYTQ